MKEIDTQLQEAQRVLSKMEEEVKAIQSEMKTNVQGTNSGWKEIWTQINDLDYKEEINIQPEQNEETRIWKNEKSSRRLWDISKCANIQIIGILEGEKEEKEIENLFEKILQENFPNLAKEIDIQIQEVQRVPNKLDTKRPHKDKS